MPKERDRQPTLAGDNPEAFRVSEIDDENDRDQARPTVPEEEPNVAVIGARLLKTYGRSANRNADSDTRSSASS